jgi:ketosteroid isomerase-like protein
MIVQQFAQSFAAAWINCWNTRDLDQLMQHYTDDFIIETPYALKIYPDCGGIISGKKEVRKYWETALSKLTALHFELLEVLTGVNAISIYYHNTISGKNVVENLFFNADGKVNKVIVTYN